MTEQTVLPAVTMPPRALVVEDDGEECEVLAGFLRLAGFDVDTARDGAAALDYLCAHVHQDRPDVMLLDMDLPRCTGAKIVHTVRGEPAYAKLKIIAVTGDEPEEFDLDSVVAQIDRWFRKPLDPECLVREMNQQLIVLPEPESNC